MNRQRGHMEMQKANISNLQHFSTGDGPGIRTTVFFKGCNLRCEWCHNPETIHPQTELLFYEKRCTRCGICEKKCENRVHRIEGQTHLVDAQHCTKCGLCVRRCPSNALELCGSEKTLEEVVSYIMEDKEFYIRSGGGVTLSGGEPLLQAEFCREVAKACQEEGIPVIVDTAANVSYRAFLEVLPYTTQFYVDLKAASEEDYEKKTKGKLSPVLNNITSLLKDGADVVIRIPMIPGFNATPEYCARMGELILSTGAKEVNLLPFHRLGSAKYHALGLPYGYESVTPPADMQRLKEAFPTGLNVSVES